MAQLLGSALIWISLGVGTLAAVTAYRPMLDAVAAEPTPLTLGMPVGKQPAPEEENAENEADQPAEDEGAAAKETKYIALFEPPKDTGELKITAEMIDALKAQDVKRIGVKEFSFARWNEKYWFLGAVVGLLAGAALMKGGRPDETSVGQSSETSDDPIDALAQAAVEVDRLIDEIGTTNLDSISRMNRIVETLEQVDRDHIETFTSGGTRLTRQLGLSGFAQLMDAFAGAERKLNRAWSAAVDKNEVESLDCLRDGQRLLREAMRRLDSLKNETL